ncbi:MAG: hypothetical protein HY330_07400, partial [Chloroflexi bacterium]|nr:hypothetical protein [Chloroflexota bacterium]
MRASTVALVLLGLAVLLPQGIGFRLPQGLLNLDLPRLAMVALVALFFLRTLGSGRLAINGAPRTLTLLLLLAAWQLVSALASEAPGASLVRAIGNALTIWLFAFAFISLAGADSQRPRVVKTLTIIGILLAAWSIFELVTQTKLFPHRNIWEGDELLRFSTTLRRVYPSLDIQLPYMSIG